MLIAELYDLTGMLTEGSGCTEACDSFHLGALIRNMKYCHLHPRPNKPSDGISVSAISAILVESDDEE